MYKMPKGACLSLDEVWVRQQPESDEANWLNDPAEFAGAAG